MCWMREEITVAIGCEGADGCFFIVAHEAAVACDIRAKDGGQFAFHATRRGVCGHRFAFLGRDILLLLCICQSL